MKDALEVIVKQELDVLDYDLVELRKGGTRRRPVLDVRIDRRDLQPVTVDDCVRASRALETRLDGEGILADQPYVLEVSSPGIDRRLVRATDWRRFTGRRASVTSPALGGRAEVEIVDVHGPDGQEVAVVRDPTGTERRIALQDVVEARLAVHWK